MSVAHARWLLMCAAAATAAASPARADKIDAKLHDAAPAILANLKAEKVTTVGVLRFRAARGPKPAGFDVGPVNDGMAARVENLLVIHADRANPVGVLRDPAREAVAARLGAWYSDPDARRRLFAHEFPLAWGGGRARPTAFLTGEVRCGGDMTTTTVTVEMFTAAAPTKLVRVAEVTVPTDRLILADLGERFSVARRSVGVRRSADLDRYAIGEARRREGGEDALIGEDPSPTAGGVDVGGVAFQLLSGGDPVTARPGAGAARWEVPGPAAGRPVAMRLTNNAGRRVGVVLKVNEVSTIFEQAEDSALCRKWVIEPGKTITVEGFYREDKQVAPFKALAGEDARPVIDQLGDKAGKIRVEVFFEAAAEDNQETTVGLPRRLPEARVGAARGNLGTLRAALMRSAALTTKTRVVTENGRAVKREVVVADTDALRPGQALNEVDFRSAPSPVAAELIQIVKQ